MWLFTCLKEREAKYCTAQKVFFEQAPSIYAFSILIKVFFIFYSDLKQRPHPELDSEVRSSRPSNLLTRCEKTSGFQDFSPPNSFLFSLSFDWCAAEHSWKSLQLLSWIFPAWCNVLMILCVVCHVQWHQNKRNIHPLKRWTSLSSQADHLCFTYRETLWIQLFALTCVRTFDSLCSQVPGHIKS